MQQLVFVEPGRLEWQDASDPEPGPGQAVVRPLAVPTPSSSGIGRLSIGCSRR